MLLPLQSEPQYELWALEWLPEESGTRYCKPGLFKFRLGQDYRNIASLGLAQWGSTLLGHSSGLMISAVIDCLQI
jgi:hypothetical protein